MTEALAALPTVTIAITNYNYARYVAIAIESAVAQDHPGVDVVVVDDGSTDDSMQVIAGFADQIKVVAQDNAGQAAALNTAWRESRGDLVIFLDADDRLHPHAASTIAKAYAAQPDLAHIQYRLEVIDEHGRPTGAVRPKRTGLMASGDLADHVRRYRSYFWQPTSGNAFPRKALEMAMPILWPERFPMSAEAWLAELTPYLGPQLSFDEVLGSYRRHSSNAYAGALVDARFLRRKIDQIAASHDGVMELSTRMAGGSWPTSLDQADDPALWAYRLGSLRLDPASHPFPDRRARVVWRGLRASLRHPMLGKKGRAHRVLWFLAVGVSPAAQARTLIERYTPDAPRA